MLCTADFVGVYERYQTYVAVCAKAGLHRLLFFKACAWDERKQRRTVKEAGYRKLPDVLVVAVCMGMKERCRLGLAITDTFR